MHKGGTDGTRRKELEKRRRARTLESRIYNRLTDGASSLGGAGDFPQSITNKCLRARKCLIVSSSELHLSSLNEEHVRKFRVLCRR